MLDKKVRPTFLLRSSSFLPNELLEAHALKINPLSDASRYVSIVREKRDGQGGDSPPNQYQQQREKKKDDDQKPEVNENTVGQAVQSFKSDTLAQANGLDASMEGNGPGLRVVLKDGTGSVVRQFTGEEFVRLREAASSDGTKRGKILDRKL